FIFAIGVEYGIYLAREKNINSVKHFLTLQVTDKENQKLFQKFYEFVKSLRRTD
ncbi:MAG: hypothetical protein MHPSP_002535, partial [Paramarteilia canceri]